MLNMDSALYFLRNDWKNRIFEDYEKERDEPRPFPIKVIQSSGRAAVWSMCAIFGVELYGVPGRSCMLLERYLHQHFNEYFNLTMDDEGRRNFKRELCARMPHLLASCIQISAKMNSASAKVSAIHVHDCLRNINGAPTVREIIDNELHVYSVLNFDIPLWTGVEEGQLLAVVIGIPQYFAECVSIIVDSAEFARDKIEEQVNNTYTNSSEFIGQGMMSLHLVMGAVVASARYLGYASSDPVPQMTSAITVPHTFIKCIADVIERELQLEHA